VELTARFDLPPDGASAGSARRVVREVLSVWGYTDEEWLYQVVLVVSELVSNALRHGGGCIGLDIQAHENGAVIGVADGSPEFRHRPQALGEGSNGRGLFIVEALTAAWGVSPHHGGKRVWVRLHPHPTPPEPDRS
jgi:anti-sigma regulatory factor (Ser/Thr protein kinase)